MSSCRWRGMRSFRSAWNLPTDLASNLSADRKRKWADPIGFGDTEVRSHVKARNPTSRVVYLPWPPRPRSKPFAMPLCAAD
jgi:hypothetical protein